ncbi:MAG: Biosynthetic peptidoglycan transglycosylase [Chroococcopsis gigantea SAG 12.99]|jgi:penicillin-binding protein 1A|nr:PBP1A family penicillin-binding protein [Chlorogloea purpurea SAG 13.99]MDV3001633.1 Biosynthetic peptidoglycan transglycosylase [Chroococcopsis gigantea SAG 12.99]
MFNKFKNQVDRALNSLVKRSQSQEEPEPTGQDSDTSTPKPERVPRRGVDLKPFKDKLNRLIATGTVQTLYSWYKNPRFWLWTGMIMGAGTSAAALGWGVYTLESRLPEKVDNLMTFARPETLTIKAADGTILQQVGPVSHERVKIWQVPDKVLKAFVSIEDRRFEQHGGVDPQGILRAMFSNLRAGGLVEGGSTITQQLARIVFLSQERSFDRKIREMRVAQKIEEKYTKGEILEKYLNLVYLGSGAYGLADGAWLYFSKPPDKLTLAEAATLAGIVPAPSVYSPLENPKAATERRNRVLQSMAEEGFITAAEAQKAIESPLVTKPASLKRFQRLAPYFTDYVRQELSQILPAKVLKSGGIVVETTLNPKWQKFAEDTVDRNISTYGRWQNFRQAAMVSIDPRNGQIRAMVGGNDHDKYQFNRVTQAKRQPGSTFKTFVYATAIAAGKSPNQSFMDAEYFVDGYKPENYGDKYSGNYVSMRDALTSSLNVVAVKVLVDVGWNPIINLARKMGIESKLNPTYSLALGASEVNLLELTSAYGTLANGGVHQKAYGISRVLDRDGKVLYGANFKPETALDKDTAAITTWMLTNVVNSGTGTPAQIGRPVAGKTGTTDKARDLWFVGYIPQLVTGVWLGNDDNQATWGASATAAMMWRQFMLPTIADISYQGFPPLPAQLEGRKPVVKAEPIKPRRSYYTMPQPQVTPNNNGTVNTPVDPQPERPRRRRRRRFNQAGVNVQTANRTYALRNSIAAPQTSVPKAVIPVQPATAPVTIPVTPASDVAPPAPPAQRRGE